MRVDRLLLAIDTADESRLLRDAGFTDDEIARLTTLGRSMRIGPLSAAREIVRCSLAVMEGEFS
ncbi:MAG: hypothetical protein IT472_09015 [Thermomonas sp.]|uniref:hypothetical protein n=1 Tax=Thermomonas sp. TaxID=1971895 RepID=UPI002615D8BD|nr:hypothetical protein [Thermomonas sp.]MCC7097306.1 hypothetical protein [Thermomonas sp.]